MVNLPIVDPYRIVKLVVGVLARDGYTGPYTGGHFAEAAILASGMLTALGVQPAVAGNISHPYVLEGQALLDSLDPRHIR